MANLTEKTLRTERKYTGKIISVDVLDIELPDGFFGDKPYQVPYSISPQNIHLRGKSATD